MELHPQLAGSLEDSKPGWFVVSPIAVSPYLSIFIHIYPYFSGFQVKEPQFLTTIRGQDPPRSKSPPPSRASRSCWPSSSNARAKLVTSRQRNTSAGRREGPARSEPTRRTEWLALEKWWRFWGIHHVFLGGIQRIHCIIPPKILVGV